MSITIELTGRQYSFNGTEYIVTMPNGDKLLVWSPPWGEFTEDEKLAGCLTYAEVLWYKENYEPLTRVKAYAELEPFFGQGAELDTWLDRHFPICHEDYQI